MKPTERYTQSLDAEMRRWIRASHTVPDFLYGMLHYHLGWSDRTSALRPSTAGNACARRSSVVTEALGGVWESPYQPLPPSSSSQLHTDP